MEHNTSFFQEILNRIMQRIMIIITSALYIMATLMKRQPQTYLTSSIMLDALNISDSEEAYSHGSDIDVHVKCEEVKMIHIQGSG